jgi:hypothetical protein
VSESPWKRGFKDWWSVGRGWIVRAVAMAAIGAGIGWLWGPLMLAHLQPWAAGLVVGVAAALLWGLVTLVATWIETFGKIIREKGAQLTTCEIRIRDLEAQLQEALGPTPVIHTRLELLEETAGFTVLDDDASTNGPLPEHQLSVRLRAKAQIDPPWLEVKCSVPIYHAFAFYQVGTDQDPIMVQPGNMRGDGVRFEFGLQPLPAGTGFKIFMFAPQPLRLKLVGRVTRSAAPPSAGPSSSRASG